ncbi:MAG TPA: PhoH family protein, partial [Vulgatibacter sp.]
TGDVTQVDLPSGRASGLADAREVLANVDGISFCTFSEVDVVRHPLVQQVVLAYDAHEAKRAAARKAAAAWAEGRSAGDASAEPAPAARPKAD